MNILEKKIENQVQFWSLLGPFFVLLSITVLLFKVSPHWYFPVSGLIGIPLCVKWKMKGMAAALGCLFLLAGMGYQQLELDDRYWHVGLSLTMAFSFIVLTLSLEEGQSLIGKLQLESQSRLDNFLLLDENWKTAEQEWLIEKDKFKTETAALMQETASLQEDKQTFYKLAQLAKDELVQVRGQYNQLLQEILYKKQQIAQLHERLEETEMTIQGFVDSDSEKQIQVLTERIGSLEREKEIFKAKMSLAQEERQACQTERERLWQALQACEEREKLSSIDQHRFQQEKEEQQNTLQVLQSKCVIMEQERHALFQTQSQLQQQYERVFQLEAQSQEIVQQLQQEQKIFTHEIKVLQERCHSFQKDFLQTHQELELKNTALLQMQEKMSSLSNELNEQGFWFKQSIEQNQSLENVKLQLEQALQETQAHLVQVRQQLESRDESQGKLLHAPGNTRRIESMYLQLKEQFREKCDVLDTTRRELFHANEELLKCKKEYQEEHLFGQSMNEWFLQHYIIQLDNQFEHVQKLYRREIEELAQLVGHLLQ